MSRISIISSIVISCILFAHPVCTREPIVLSQQTIKNITNQYGSDGRDRVLQWLQLLKEQEVSDELQLINAVNLFFNKIKFIDDILHWKKKDYWATPIEFLASGGGDCEDFSIAKYTTLKALGIEDAKLNITYVKALSINRAHMVLTYFPTSESIPLVIDNLTDEILPASERTDLLPVYSFNGSGLWLAKQQGRGKLVGSSKRLKLWQDTIQRMAEDFN